MKNGVRNDLDVVGELKLLMLKVKKEMKLGNNDENLVGWMTFPVTIAVAHNDLVFRWENLLSSSDELVLATFSRISSNDISFGAELGFAESSFEIAAVLDQ